MSVLTSLFPRGIVGPPDWPGDASCASPVLVRRGPPQDNYGLTVTVTVLVVLETAVVREGAQGRIRRAGLKVTWVSQRPSSGGSGVDQPGDQGELRPTRVSSHVTICGGSKVAPPGPR